MKTCPYCAEEVQDEAIVCKHCGRDLAPEAVALVAQGISRNDVKSDERAKEPRRIHRAHLNPVGELRIQGDKLMDLVHSQQHDGQAIRNDIPAFLDGLSESFSMTQDDKVLRLANGLRETGSILAEEIMEGWSQQVLDTFYFNQREWNKELLALESFVSGKVSTYQYGRPPWYRTSWFYILLIFLPLGQPFFVYLVLTDPKAHIAFKIIAWLGLLQIVAVVVIVILALLGPGLSAVMTSIQSTLTGPETAPPPLLTRIPSATVESVSPNAIAEPQQAGPDFVGGFEIPTIDQGKFNIAMVLIGPHDDGGWSETHYDGLIYVRDNVPDSHVAFIELVPEGADSEEIFRSLARRGFDLIIGTSFGYMNPMEIVASEFPDQMFIHLTGFKTNFENYGSMFGEMEVFMYMAGMLAGSRAKTDGNPRLGYMATFPIPEEMRLGNAIMLGAKQTCPECTMDVLWINTWHHPAVEREGAAFLFDNGAQVVFSGADTPAAGDVATERGKWGVNYNHVNVCQTDGCLTAPYWSWGPVYADIARGTIDGTYSPGFQYFESSEDGMGLYGFMEGQVPQPGIHDLPVEDVQLVRDTLAAALMGDFNRFDVFKGPIFDNQGNLVLADDVPLEQLDLDGFAEFGSPCETCMFWWAEGITAELPDQGG